MYMYSSGVQSETARNVGKSEFIYVSAPDVRRF